MKELKEWLEDKIRDFEGDINLYDSPYFSGRKYAYKLILEMIKQFEGKDPQNIENNDQLLKLVHCLLEIKNTLKDVHNDLGNIKWYSFKRLKRVKTNFSKSYDNLESVLKRVCEKNINLSKSLNVGAPIITADDMRRNSNVEANNQSVVNEFMQKFNTLLIIMQDELKDYSGITFNDITFNYLFQLKLSRHIKDLIKKELEKRGYFASWHYYDKADIGIYWDKEDFSSVFYMKGMEIEEIKRLRNLLNGESNS